MEAPARPAPDHLASGEYLPTAGLLVAADRSHYGLLGTDGRFAVCKGYGPSDPTAQVVGQFPAESQPQGAYFIVMQADGNLCIYRGSGPTDQQGQVWGLNMVRHDLPRPAGPDYRAVLTTDGNLCVYDRNAGHDPREGPYWEMTPHYAPEEEFTSTNVQFATGLQPPWSARRPHIRHRIQPRRTCQLTRLTVAIGASERYRPCDVRIAVYRGGLDSTDLMIAESFTPAYRSPSDLIQKQREPYDFRSPPLLVGGEIYTLELSTAATSPERHDPSVIVGIDAAIVGPAIDDHLCFTAWTLRP
jgi:hypothetical protein